MRKIFFVFALLFFSVSTRASPDDPWTWDEKRFGGVVTQGLDNSCGLASLLTIMQTHFGDMRNDEGTLLKKYMQMASAKELAEAMSNGLSLLELEKMAQTLGYSTKKKVLTFGELKNLTAFVPVLVYLEVGKQRHFTVVRGANESAVFLGDPSRGNVEYSKEEFLTEWKTLPTYEKETGAALIIVKKEGDFSLKLLRDPEIETPPSFEQMRRQMIPN